MLYLPYALVGFKKKNTYFLANYYILWLLIDWNLFGFISKQFFVTYLFGDIITVNFNWSMATAFVYNSVNNDCRAIIGFVAWLFVAG